MRTLLITLITAVLMALPVGAQSVRVHLTQAQLAELVPDSKTLFEEAKDLTNHMRHLEAVAHLHRAAELSPDSIPLQRLTAQVAEERLDRAESLHVETLCQVAILAHQRIRSNPLASEAQTESASQSIDELLAKIEEINTEDPVDNRYTRSINRLNVERQTLLEIRNQPEIVEHQADPEADRQTPPPDLGQSLRPSDSSPPPLNERHNLPLERP